ncbi:hypothetical protein HaLaN_28306, partial [Haematococcus lacustris]
MLQASAVSPWIIVRAEAFNEQQVQYHNYILLPQQHNKRHRQPKCLAHQPATAACLQHGMMSSHCSLIFPSTATTAAPSLTIARHYSTQQQAGRLMRRDAKADEKGRAEAHRREPITTFSPQHDTAR